MKPWELAAQQLDAKPASLKPWEMAAQALGAERQNVRRGLNPDGSRLLPGAGSERTASRVSADSRQVTTTDLPPEERIKRAEETRLREAEEAKERGLGTYTADRLQSMGGGALNAISGLVDAANTDYGTGLPPVLESSIAVGSSILGRLGVDKAREVADSMAANAKPKSEFARSFADTAGEYAQGADANLTWRERAAKRKLAEAEGVTGKLAYLAQNPGQVAELAADSLPYMAAGGGVGALVGRVAPAAAVATNLGTQGVMSASSSAQEARGMIDQLPDEELAQLPEYQALLANYDAPTARKILSQRANDEAFASGLVTNAVTLGLTAKLPSLEKVLHGAAGGSTSRAVNALRTGATETAQEGLQGGGERLATNIGASASDSRVGLTDKLGEAALLEGIVGGPMGAAGGFIQTPAQEQRALAEDLKAQRAVAETPDEVGTLDAGIALSEARADQAAKAPWRINKAAREAAKESNDTEYSEGKEDRGLDAVVPVVGRPAAIPGNPTGASPSVRYEDAGTGSAEPANGNIGGREGSGVQAQRNPSAQSIPEPVPEAVLNQDAIDEAELERLLAGAFPDSEMGIPITEQNQSLTDANGQEPTILASRHVDDAPVNEGIEAEELDPNDPVIARMLAEQEAGMTARETERREGTSDAISEGLRAVAQNPTVFRSRLYTGKTMGDVASEGQLPYAQRSRDDEYSADVHHFVVDQGAKGKNEARIHEGKNDVWVDVSDLKSGGGRGEEVYSAAFSLARNQGKSFIEDPRGLSDTAMYRRVIQELSGILKADDSSNVPTGEFLASQRTGGPKTRPVPVDPGRKLNPAIRERALTAHANAILAVPEVKGIRYDTDTNQFVDRTGQVITDADFDGLAAYRQANPVGEAMVRKRTDSGDKSAAPVGGNTLKLAALVETLRVVPEGDRSRVVGQLRALASGSDGLGSLKGILPSRSSENARSVLRDGPVSSDRTNEADGDKQGVPGKPRGGANDSAPKIGVDAIRETITRAYGYRAKRLLDSGRTKVVQSEREVPAEIRSRSEPLASADGTIQGFYDQKTGDSYLIADNFKRIEDVGPVFLHEEGVHAGMKAILGDRFDAIAKRLGEIAESGNTTDKAIAAKAKRRAERAGTPAKYMNEEWIAYTVQLSEQAKQSDAKPTHALRRWLNSVYEAISAWAAQRGLKNLSINDLRVIAIGTLGHRARVGENVQPSRTDKDTITVDGKDDGILPSRVVYEDPMDNPEKYGLPKPMMKRGLKKLPRHFDENYDDLLDFIALHGGLHREEWQRQGIDPSAWFDPKNKKAKSRNRRFRASGPPVFRKGEGMTPADLREKMEQWGFMQRDSEDGVAQNDDNDAISIVFSAMNQGEKFYTYEGREIQAKIAGIRHDFGEAERHDDDTAAELGMTADSMNAEDARAENRDDYEDTKYADFEQTNAEWKAELIQLKQEAEDRRERARIAYREKASERIVSAEDAARNKRQEAASSLGVNGPSFTWELDANRFAEGVKGAFNRLRLEIQDKYGAIAGAQKDIEKVIGKLISDSMNVWRRENLMHGRVSGQIKDLNDNHVKPAKDAMKELGIQPDLVEDYFEARAAEARNKHVAKINPNMPDGGAGISTADAKAFLDGSATGHRSGVALTPELRRKVEKVAKMFDAVRDQTRQRLLDSGQITQAQYDSLEPTYAPLRGKDGEEIGKLRNVVGGGIDVRGKPIKRAMGRGEGNRAVNILAEIIGDAERSIVQAEKTRVGQTLVRLILGNPNKDVWEVEPVLTERKYSESQDLVYEAMKAIDNDPGAVRVMIKGKPYRVLLKDERMAKAIKNLGAEQLPGVFKLLGSINRYFSAVLTRYNPAFVPINMIRDLGLGIIGITSEYGMKQGAQAAWNYLPAMRALWREARGKASNSQTMTYAKEYKDVGGRTGFQKYENVEEIAQALNDEFKGFVQLMKEKKPYYYIKRALRDSKTVKLIEDANDTIENTMRLAAFIARRKAGASPETAAEYAKNITVNFNRRGHQTGWLNSSFLFFNAATQGSTRTFQLLKNPKVLATMGAMASLQFVFGMLAMGADDEDEDGVTAWEKVSDQEKLRNFIIPIVGEKNGEMTVKLVKIPMPYGFNFFTYLGGRLAQATNSKDEADITSLTNDLGVAAVDAVSPLKFTDGMQGMKPYLMKIFDSIGYNENDFGSDITSEQPYARYEIPRASLGRASTPEPYHIAAKALNTLGGGDEVTKPRILENFTDRSPEDLRFLTEAFGGGLLRTGTQAASAGQKAFAGVDLSFNDIPILKSLFSEVDMERATQDRYYKLRERIARETARVKIAFEKDGVEAARDLLNKTPELKGYRLHRFETGKYTNKNGQIQLEAVNEKDGDTSLAKEFKAAEKALGDIADRINTVRSDRDKSMTDRMLEIEALEKEREAAQRKLNVKWKEANG